MITNCVKNIELNYLMNVNIETRADQIEAISLDINTIDEALKTCQENIYSALGVLMWAVNARETVKIQNTLAEIRFKEEVASVLREYKEGLIQAIDESRESTFNTSNLMQVTV